jgi:hypothetical protein
MITEEIGRRATGLVNKTQTLFLRLGIDDRLTAFLLLAVGAGMVVHTVRGRKRETAHVDTPGSTWLQETGF